MPATSHRWSIWRRYWPWLASLALPAAAWLACTDVWLPPGASTVSLWHADEMFNQCSREAPKPDGAYWIPTSAQIRAIEPALPALARRVPQDYRNLPALTDPTLRQYTGFTLKGQRLIYVNFGPDDWRFTELLHERERRDGPAHRWPEVKERLLEKILPERPLNMCDGGAFFWGVVYNPATRTFAVPQFNGR